MEITKILRVLYHSCLNLRFFRTQYLKKNMIRRDRYNRLILNGGNMGLDLCRNASRNSQFYCKLKVQKAVLSVSMHIFFGLFGFLLLGCHAEHDANSLKVGTISGPETALMVTAQKVAEKEYGLKLKIIPFTDYTMPNEALADGSIDANAFQTKPYLDDAMAKRDYKMVVAGKTFIYPVGIYSQKIKQLSQLTSDSTVAIPNDPSNEARALLLLQSAGLITLEAGALTVATVNEVVSNPKNLHIKTIDASQLPRALPDVDIAVITTNYAMLAGLLPSHDALFLETPESPYANLIVVKQGHESDKRIKELVSAFQSPAVIQKANALFKGQAIPAWIALHQ